MTKKKAREFPTECLLRRDPKNSQVCEESQCWRCGWNEQEARYRQRLLAAKGLTMCSDGLRRLVMPARNFVKEESK
ncbi:MAG: hypothetical protein ACI3V1_02510 [Faecousia sp.]